MNKKKKKIEIEIPKKKQVREEDDLLYDKNGKINDSLSEKESIDEGPLINENNKIKESKFKQFLKLPLIYYFFILLFFSVIIFFIYYIYYYNLNEPNFKIVEPKWDIMDLTKKKYENYIFDNGLEILLVQDTLLDKDGGCIAIGKGYMDNPLDEGISEFAGRLLDFIEFGSYNESINDEKNLNLNDLREYYGKFGPYFDEEFTNYCFYILNNGFKKFIYFFSQVLNINTETISLYFDRYYNEILSQIEKFYNNMKKKIFIKERHLLEYLVYGLKNEKGEEILPEGNIKSLSKYTKEEIKSKVIDYIIDLIDPKNIKIIIFSKYKLLTTSKLIKKYFNYLITKKSPKDKSFSTRDTNNKNQTKFQLQKFNTSQMIYLKTEYNGNYFIDILYYIDKKENESYSELIYKSHYLNYIKDILSETKEGSLYYLLTNNSLYNIKSISADYEYVLKSKIEFYIYIELNYLQNLYDIIFIVFQYMNKIVKEAIGNNMQMGRYFELKHKFYQQAKYNDKNIEIVNLSIDYSKKLFLTKYEKKYFFYPDFIPWTENDSERKIQNDSAYYFNQLKPENSVIVFCFPKTEMKYIKNNNNTKFYENLKYFNDDIIKNSTYYDIEYLNDVYNFNASEYEDFFEDEFKPNITFINNDYLSFHNESFVDNKNEETKIFQLKNKTSFYKFYFKRNTNFNIPKVYISLNLFHPYLRPMNEDEFSQHCYYFKIIEMFSAIKRKINKELSEALRAGNEIEFGQNENYLFINIFCYEDMAYKILEQIRDILFKTDWKLTDFISNNEIYKNEAFRDFLINSDVWDFSKYCFYSKLKNHFFNTNEFFTDYFEYYYYKDCINNSFNDIEFRYLNTFIINGYIYGYYKKEQAQNISDLFDVKLYIDDFINILFNTNNSEIKDNSPEYFINWMNEIHELTENDDVDIYINLNLIDDYLLYNYNYGISYIKFNESMLSVSLLESILQKIDKEEYLYGVNMFRYKDIYLELIFISDNFDEILPNDSIIYGSWNSTLYNAYVYNTAVDNIGNKYYYLRKNFRLNLFQQQKSLIQRAKDEFQAYLYEGTIIDPGEVSEMYDKKYKNKNFDKKELNDTINYYINTILKRKRIDIYFHYYYNK